MKIEGNPKGIYLIDLLPKPPWWHYALAGLACLTAIVALALGLIFYPEVTVISLVVGLLIGSRC